MNDNKPKSLCAAILAVVLLALTGIAANNTASAADNQLPLGTFTATLNSSVYISFGAAGEVSTNVYVASGPGQQSAWFPDASLRRLSDNTYYFPAHVSIPAGTSGFRCTYYGRINVFVVSDNEIDLTADVPAQIAADNLGNCTFTGILTSTNTFHK